MNINKATLFLLVATLFFASCEEEEDKVNDGTGSSVNIKRGLVLNYTFDEGSAGSVTMLVKDNSTSGLDGVVQGNASFETDTPSGNGYSLRLRKGDYVNIPDGLATDSTNVTVALWVKDFGHGHIFTTFSSNGGIGTPTLYVNEQDKMCYQYETHGYGYSWSHCVFSNDIVPYQSSGWHHVACTSSMSTGIATLFIDGVQVDAQSVNQRKLSSMKMQIGGSADGGVVSSDPMYIDNVRVYNRCLNAKEVKKLYSGKQ